MTAGPVEGRPAATVQQRLTGAVEQRPAATVQQRPMGAVQRRLATVAEGGWSYLAGAVAFGLAEALFTLWTGRAIGITSHLIGIPVAFPRLSPGAGRGELVLAGALLVAGIVGGAALGAVRGREWRLRLPRRWQPPVLAAVGGFLMGVGARLAPGCNVGGVIGGIASSSLQGWVEGLFMLAGVLLGIKLALRAESLGSRRCAS